MIKRTSQMVDHTGNLILRSFFVFLLQVTKDAVHGSEAGKAISFYVLDALISIDHDKYFLNQLQSRGILRSCLSDVTNYLSKVCIATTISFFFFFHFDICCPSWRL
jgi:nuclear pore complex protein Nup205